MISKSKFIQDILDSALENPHHNNSWYEEPESKPGAFKRCTRCNKSYIEEKTRIRTEDDAVIIRRHHIQSLLFSSKIIGEGRSNRWYISIPSD